MADEIGIALESAETGEIIPVLLTSEQINWKDKHKELNPYPTAVTKCSSCGGGYKNVGIYPYIQHKKNCAYDKRVRIEEKKGMKRAATRKSR